MNNNNDDKLAEFKELFSFYDKDNDNLIDMSDFEKILLCLGIILSEKKNDEKNLKEKFFIIKENKYLISFDNCIEYIKTRSNLNDLEEEIIDCFKSINKKADGKISFLEMKQALMNMGEDFDDEEIKEFFVWVDAPNEEGMTYEDFIKILSTK